MAATGARTALLEWYDRQKRDLPWRRTRDPYAVWVSEIMLQQTRVETVVPRWRRFLDRFPTVRALAGAPLDDVLAEWSGLGYYARARNLHSAARDVCERYGGRVPDDAAAIRTLPGVGRYTAGAILSIAYDRREPVVDGNVERVLTRLHLVEGDPRKEPAREALWRHAAELVDGDRPGDLNQALMELGARVCLPRTPTCLLCPLRDRCAARAAGRADELPHKAARKEVAEIRLVAALVRSPRGVLLGRRPAAGLFGGLWELPCIERLARESAAEALGRLGPLIGRRLQAGAAQATVEQELSHRRLSVEVHTATIEPGRRGRLERYEALRFVAPSGLAERGLSSLTSRILAASGVPTAGKKAGTSDRERRPSGGGSHASRPPAPRPGAPGRSPLHPAPRRRPRRLG